MNPETPFSKIKPALGLADFVLVMAVHPGFGGQEFIKEALPKVGMLRRDFRGDIAVDGGVNDETGKLVAEAGANILVAGSYIFKSKNYSESIRRLRCVI